MRLFLYVVVVLLYFKGYGIMAQNLVKNSSFENYHECPNTLGTFDKNVKSWSTPTTGTTDYFNTCSAVMSAPENFNGIQHPKNGSAYAGLYFYAPGDYREYIQVQLKKVLRPGKTYKLSFYISLAEGSDFAVKDFGVVCSYKPIAVNTKKELSKGRLYGIKGNKFHFFEINHPKFHEDKSDWLEVTTSFTAKGYEKYLLLGNLRNNKLTRKVQTKRKETKKGAYYYIDMVSLSLEGTEQIMPSYELDSILEFKNILFDFDRFKLNETAKADIDALLDYLKQNLELKITIIGHTDNKGSKAYNQSLSLKRAKSIVDYLIKLGLSKNRIDFKGHGSTRPISKNDTELGRQINRRVEFMLYY
ncbi:OmpA family protein [uncultured Croceitalea sp.]|uniref:OmpA family protein n=1 Tax=uncultured Croceitalea sp. TaxID=1798908 RepID=UPI003305CB1A